MGPLRLKTAVDAVRQSGQGMKRRIICSEQPLQKTCLQETHKSHCALSEQQIQHSLASYWSQLKTPSPGPKGLGWPSAPKLWSSTRIKACGSRTRGACPPLESGSKTPANDGPAVETSFK